MSVRKCPDPSPEEVAEEIRAVRERARSSPGDRPPVHPEAGIRSEIPAPLPPIGADPTGTDDSPPVSPPREALNRLWNVASDVTGPSGGLVGKIFSPVRALLRRLFRFAFGALIERQTEMNSAQVRFDNEIVSYLDARLDRMSRHYDHVLGLHGRRMGEIDERHLILQQELVRHVHDLVERIEFVFETAEQNHLYLEGLLREHREELGKIAERLRALAKDER